MTGFRHSLPLLLFVICLAVTTPVHAVDTDCATRIEQLEQQNQQLHQQLRAAKRQLAQTENAGQRPGWPQILGGVGIIFGLFGVGMMVNARKKS